MFIAPHLDRFENVSFAYRLLVEVVRQILHQQDGGST
jgi:hypothetical protein